MLTSPVIEILVGRLQHTTQPNIYITTTLWIMPLIIQMCFTDVYLTNIMMSSDLIFSDFFLNM